MNMGRPSFTASLLAAAILGISLTAQKVSTNVSIVSDIFLTDTGLLPLPDNAVELERISTIRSERFRSPLRLALGTNGLLYASSWYNDAVLAFDLQGVFQSRLGGETPRKGFLKSPDHIAAGKNGLIMHETDRSRPPFDRYDVHCVSYDGKTLRKVDSTLIDDIAWDPNGRILAAPRIESRSSRLIVAYGPDGSMSAFGAPRETGTEIGLANWRSMTVLDMGEIYVAFRLVPILRRYSSNGALRGEIEIHSPVIDAKNSFNREVLRQATGGSADRGGSFQVIFKEIAVCGNRAFLLSHHPRLEITEIDASGQPSATYWMECPEIYTTNDIAVADVGGELRFFVSRADPPRYEIDIFRISKRMLPPGLLGELEKLSNEIIPNPGYFLNWHNRGIVKHQLGDYQGAIDDLTKAIELATDRALPYHNRGLARVKVKQYAAAVEDFTKAVELAPTAQSFYDRGIARALMADYEKAVVDFERAGEMDPAFREKSSEQIIVCRRLLKAGKKDPGV